MKTIKIFVALVVTLLIGTSTFAQSASGSTGSQIKIEKINVGGNCASCKTRIEKAAKISGVVKADWSTSSKVLTLSYDSSKTSSDAVQKSIAAAGHDTPLYTATDKAYNSLPSCCKYRK